MSWKDQFKRFKGEWDQFNTKHNLIPGSQSQQQAPLSAQSQTQQQAPPPQQPLNPSTYWRANFDPSHPITQEWDPKQGNNNGWGNNELQNYTGNPSNAFYTGDHKLILRAIANSSHPDPAQKYTSARLVSRQRLTMDRGVLTAFVTPPCATGIWPAFWLLPFEPFNWPVDGEIDITETWNGDRVNHSCLHWGFFDAKDWNKHVTKETHIADFGERAVRFDLAWDQPGGQPGQGRLVWSIDGRPVMKAGIPGGTRPLRDFNVLFNVAMGGNVNAGKVPSDGAYDFVVHYCGMSSEPEGGWGRFENDWQSGPDGKVG